MEICIWSKSSMCLFQTYALDSSLISKCSLGEKDKYWNNSEIVATANGHILPKKLMLGSVYACSLNFTSKDWEIARIKLSGLAEWQWPWTSCEKSQYKVTHMYVDISLPSERHKPGWGQGPYHPVSEDDFTSRKAKFNSHRLVVGIWVTQPYLISASSSQNSKNCCNWT